MTYLVMECHPAYAVVLDQEGRFLKVANMNYSVGDRVTDVIIMKENTTQSPAVIRWKRLTPIVAAAACFVIMLAGVWQMFFAAYGTVRMQINPDVQVTVNRIDRVIGVEGLNGDGVALIDGYSYRRKDIDTVSDELADRAREMGYLTGDGTIRLTVESRHEKWKTATEERLILELKVHMGGNVEIIAGTQDGTTQAADPQNSEETSSSAEAEIGITVPVAPSDPVKSDAPSETTAPARPDPPTFTPPSDGDDDDGFEDRDDIDDDFDDMDGGADDEDDFDDNIDDDPDDDGDDIDDADDDVSDGADDDHDDLYDDDSNTADDDSDDDDSDDDDSDDDDSDDDDSDDDDSDGDDSDDDDSDDDDSDDDDSDDDDDLDD